jgi:hypothetical protein
MRLAHIFVATGRKPNTDDLGLKKVGVAVSAHGIINADERLSTNVRGTRPPHPPRTTEGPLWVTNRHALAPTPFLADVGGQPVKTVQSNGRSDL